MIYKVKFVYMDGKDLDLNIDDAELKNLFQSLNNREIYWSSEDKIQGFWLDIERVRYIQCFALQEVKIDENKEIGSCQEEIPCEVSDDSNGEEEIESE